MLTSDPIIKMPDSLATRLRHTLDEVDTLYYRLALLVGAPQTGKTTVLRQLESQQNWLRLNVNLALCERLLELTRRQRALRVPRILADLVDVE